MRPALTFAALGLGLFAARTAAAQPNPFEDYDRFKTEAPGPAAPILDRAPVIRTAPWTWSVGLGAQISFSRLTYQRGTGGDDGSVMTLMFRATPTLRVFVADRIQLGLSPGFMARAGGSNSGDDASDANMLIEATGHYFAPISQRTSFVPGLGLGGYFGSGSRTLDILIPKFGPVRAGVDTATSGMSLSLYLGIAYQLDARIQLRAGLAANVLFGWDSIENRKDSLRSSATHIGLPVELSYSP